MGWNRVLAVALLALAGTLAWGSVKVDGISSKPFGSSDGKPVELYTLTNSKGMKATIMTYGATVVSLTSPDRKGHYEHVICGYESLAEYKAGSPYFGCIVGRYGNRIAKGKFTLDGKTYTLAKNNGPNSLHGGLKGFDKRVWDASPAKSTNGPSLALSYVSVDGEEGYPGKLTSRVVYTLTNDNALKIEYEVSTDKATVQNLTNHCYFNLGGPDARDNLDHLMMLNADRFTPIDKTSIPTGELKSVSGTPFDFRKPMAIGARIDGKDHQLQNGKGYDHNWIVNGKMGTLRLAARVEEPKTGRIMEVMTTEPGIQFYSGNFLDGTNIGFGNKAYVNRFAFCLETQHYPDSPNHPKFPTTTLRPGKKYRSTTVYKFSAK